MCSLPYHLPALGARASAPQRIRHPPPSTIRRLPQSTAATLLRAAGRPLPCHKHAIGATRTQFQMPQVRSATACILHMAKATCTASALRIMARALWCTWPLTILTPPVPPPSEQPPRCLQSWVSWRQPGHVNTFVPTCHKLVACPCAPQFISTPAVVMHELLHTWGLYHG